jgi:hypothetical protein
MIMPEIETVKDVPILKTRPVLLPSTVRFVVVGPVIVRSLLIASSPLVKVIIAAGDKLNLIVSPLVAAVMASRKEQSEGVHAPSIESVIVLTVQVVAAA